MTKRDRYQEAMDHVQSLLTGTGWEWEDPAWAVVFESNLICPCGNVLEIDADKCHCGEVNPIVKKGLI